MRAQRRNEIEIWYALYEGNVPILKNGRLTGEKKQVYSAPVSLRANVSAAKGAADVEMFGIDTPYTKTITTCDISCPIAEDSALWIDADPLAEPYNYVVVRIAKSLNSITYAVREVDVS